MVYDLFPISGKMGSALFARKRAMTSRPNQGAQGSINSERLAEVLDKLVAVQLDLDPISRSSGQGAESDKIANACKVLHSPIADFREIIRQVDGLDPLGVR